MSVPAVSTQQNGASAAASSAVAAGASTSPVTGISEIAAEQATPKRHAGSATPTPTFAAGSPAGASAQVGVSSPASATIASPATPAKPGTPPQPTSSTPATPAPADASAEAPASVKSPLLSASESLKQGLKDLPKVAADAAKQAGKSYVDAGKEAKGTVKALTSSFLSKKGPTITITADQIVTVLFLGGLATQVLLIPIFLPSAFRLVYSLVWGVLVGLGLSFLFYLNHKRKAETNELLAMNLGLKGLKRVVGDVPSWINLAEKEKMEWVNELILEVWPFIDKGVCQIIKDITAQVMPGVLKSLPAGLNGVVKSIGFKHLTFGNAPFRVESIWVSPTDKDRLVLELSVKWCGDPNITLAIETPTGKMCPRVMDIIFVATIRVVLCPLVDRIPGFVGAMVTVPAPPMIKYRLDFGKALGGSMAPAAVRPVINYFMKEVITAMLVWPQRLVVPILQETDQDRVEIQRLMRRHQGVLRVCVVRCKELASRDWVGSNDVLVELTTDSVHKECTDVRPPDHKVRARMGMGHTKAPPKGKETFTFMEYIYLLIQEPADQMLRMEVFDIDSLDPTKLLKGQVTQVVGARQLIGRALVKLGETCREGLRGSTDPMNTCVHLGDGDWGSPGGPGKGMGKVSLSLNFWPFERFTKNDVENALTGIVTIRLLKVWGLATAGDTLAAFVRVTSTAVGAKEWRSSVRSWSKRAHIQRLKNEIARLTVDADRDRREGRPKAAERKARYIAALEQVTAPRCDENKIRLTVEMDYMLDSNAMAAIYHVKLTDVIKVKVMEANMLASSECLGRLDIPVSDIITSSDVNPMTGLREYGLHRRRWEEYNPDVPERGLEQLERGLALEEGDGARIWVEMRWVPCIQPDGGLSADWDAPADATPQMSQSQGGAALQTSHSAGIRTSQSLGGEITPAQASLKPSQSVR
ncbi:hypothetical protein HYH03_008710 [Edaphochlamys debaryana]|uniref:SMP-LTD domain-containing protein n=1 Tax=Edaphochlamys debaryana TaxID=47281 RepID=A0A836BYJ8_9CHLO|nr:hypothetical protein HYH03_008710 [Edaphochlamys debaryana]|eukprot:KAG2493047.1 hypothetical protein HYH03_008710 [Edaphochlamys debaryana]